MTDLRSQIKWKGKTSVTLTIPGDGWNIGNANGKVNGKKPGDFRNNTSGQDVKKLILTARNR